MPNALARLSAATNPTSTPLGRVACAATLAWLGMASPQVSVAATEDRANSALFVAHKANYILPLNATNRINRGVYTATDSDLSNLIKAEEVSFQLSLKVRLTQDRILHRDDAFFFGFTLASWWQLYSRDISSPFRETNYQPEVFYTTPVQWRPFGAESRLTLGLEHQSNGQVQAYSRSWNRVYAEMALQKDAWFAAWRPWYRIPEDPKPSPDSALGDDNPGGALQRGLSRLQA
ncbi:MAG: phospholipase A, partial [Pseudomonadota bacterium]